MRNRYHRSLLAGGCTCFQLFSVQTIALHWTKPNLCRYCCWLFDSYIHFQNEQIQSRQTFVVDLLCRWCYIYTADGLAPYLSISFNMDFLLHRSGKIDNPGQIMIWREGQMSGLYQSPFYMAATYLWSRLQQSSVLYISDIAVLYFSDSAVLYFSSIAVLYFSDIVDVYFSAIVVVYFSDIPDDQIASQLILFAYRRLSPSSAERW